MRKYLILTFATITFIACNHPINKTTDNKTDNTKTLKAENPNHLKTKREYEEIFLEGSTDKIIAILGTPDFKRESPDGYNGYYVYYQKVWDDDMARHLVIAYHDNKVVLIKSAIFGERIALPAGNIKVERPAGYQSEEINANDEIAKIDRMYSSVDTVHTTAFIDGENGVFYRTYQVGNLTLLKRIRPGDEDTSYTEYLFVDGKVRFQYGHDELKWFTTQKVYISYNGNVIKYLRDNEDTPCDKNEYCKYDESATPYFLLKKHGKN